MKIEGQMVWERKGQLANYIQPRLPSPRRLVVFPTLFFSSFLALQISEHLQKTMEWESHNPDYNLRYCQIFRTF